LNYKRICDIINLISEKEGVPMKFRKIIAPVIITVLLICALAGFLATYLSAPIPDWVKIFCTVIGLSLIGESVFVLVERIKEIKKGEEDDLSQY
jgi:hypothetical protein